MQVIDLLRELPKHSAELVLAIDFDALTTLELETALHDHVDLPISSRRSEYELALLQELTTTMLQTPRQLMSGSGSAGSVWLELDVSGWLEGINQARLHCYNSRLEVQGKAFRLLAAAKAGPSTCMRLLLDVLTQSCHIAD